MARISSEFVDDAEAIDAVHRAAFSTLAEAQLVQRLRLNRNLIISQVYVEAGQVVGHIAFSPVTVIQASLGSKTGLGLGPVAVLPEHQRKGIGGRLVESGLVEARNIGCAFVVVLGDPCYYSRFGFEPASRWGLFDEYGGGEAFQAQEFIPGSIADSRGLVKYGDEFSILTDESAT